jgi:two-component system response regulator DegU
MMEKSTKVMLVTGPGSLTEGLVALLTALSELELVGQASDLSAAVSLLEQHKPDLVLLRTNLPRGGAWVLLERMQSSWPEIKCLVLAEDVEKQKLAEENYATVVILEGSPVSGLVTAIERLARQVQGNCQTTDSKEPCGPEKGGKR